MQRLTTILLCLISLAASAQRVKDDKVPAVVKAAFAKRFPSLKAAYWNKEDNQYEVAFTKDGKETTASFDPDGVWRETETEIEPSVLPKAITTYLQAHYSGKKVRKAARIQTADGNSQYEVELSKYEVFFDSNGAFLKAERRPRSTRLDLDL